MDLTRRSNDCALCKDAEVRVKDLEELLKHAQSRALNGIRQAAKLKVELEQKEKEDDTFRQKVRSVEAREVEAQEEYTNMKQQIQEMKYQRKCLTAELAEKKEMIREMKLRTNARIAHLSKTVQETEDAALNRSERMKSAAKSLQQTVLDLQRHLGSQGFHAVNSFTARKLMDSLWDASAKLCRASESGLSDIRIGKVGSPYKGDPREIDGWESDSSIENDELIGNFSRSTPVTRRRSKVEGIKTQAERNAMLEAAKSGRLTIAGSDSVAKDLSDLCQNLESENKKLRRRVNDLSGELKRAETGFSLVPKYRMAIVQARSKAQSLKDRVAELEEENNRLSRVRGQGEKSVRKAEFLQQRVQELEGKVEDLISENDRLRGQIRKTHDNEKQRRNLLRTIRKEREAFITVEDGEESWFDVKEVHRDRYKMHQSIPTQIDHETKWCGDKPTFGVEDAFATNSDPLHAEPDFSGYQYPSGLSTSFVGDEEVFSSSPTYSLNLQTPHSTRSSFPTTAAAGVALSENFGDLGEGDWRKYEAGYTETVPLSTLESERQRPYKESKAGDFTHFSDVDLARHKYESEDLTTDLKHDLETLNSEILALQKSLANADKLMTPRSTTSGAATPRSISSFR